MSVVSPLSSHGFAFDQSVCYFHKIQSVSTLYMLLCMSLTWLAATDYHTQVYGASKDSWARSEALL